MREYFTQLKAHTVDSCESLANLGDPEGHFCAGILLRRADATGNAARIAMHMEVAARAGHLYAQNDIGDMLLTGKAVQKDFARAFKWLMLAARRGMPHAAVSIGWMYMCGLGVEIDYRKARYWNLRGADWDHAEGANNLGWLLERGLGGPVDLDAARHWYTMAARWGSDEAEDRLANLETGDDDPAPNTNDCGQ